MAPSAQSFGALMTAMQRSGKWQKGLLAFSAMKEAINASLKVDVGGPRSVLIREHLPFFLPLKKQETSKP